MLIEASETSKSMRKQIIKSFRNTRNRKVFQKEFY